MILSTLFLALFALTFTTIGEGTRICPNKEWISFTTNRRIHCYYFSTKDFRLDWEAAQTWCKTNNASLVEIETWEENRFLEKEAADRYIWDFTYWLGATDSKVEGTWLYAESENPVKFHRYWGYYGHRKGDNADCLGARNTNNLYRWGDFACDEEMPFICKTKTSLPV